MADLLKELACFAVSLLAFYVVLLLAHYVEQILAFSAVSVKGIEPRGGGGYSALREENHVCRSSGLWLM
jgi:hypothetical protein